MLARGPEHYTLADSPQTAPQVRILPGQECVSLTGQSMAEAMGLGIRTWGNSADGSTAALIGAYEGHSEVGRRLTAALPPLAVLHAGEWDSPVVPLLDAELGREEPGQQAVLGPAPGSAGDRVGPGLVRPPRLDPSGVVRRACGSRRRWRART